MGLWPSWQKLLMPGDRAQPFELGQFVDVQVYYVCMYVCMA